MTPGQKLRAFLEARGKGAKAELARILEHRYKRKSTGQVPGKWMADRGFIKSNQALVIEIYGLPENYFDDCVDAAYDGLGVEEEPSRAHEVRAGSSVVYKSLRRFLEDPPEPIEPDERLFLASQRFDPSLGDIGTDAWWYGELKTYRFHRRTMKSTGEPLDPGPESGGKARRVRPRA